LATWTHAQSGWLCNTGGMRRLMNNLLFPNTTHNLIFSAVGWKETLLWLSGQFNMSNLLRFPRDLGVTPGGPLELFWRLGCPTWKQWVGEMKVKKTELGEIE
jgi:hypothetical protein